MKFRNFNRAIAALLMITMLAGQMLMSTAMALNEEPGMVILDESDLPEASPTIVEDGVNAATPEGEDGIILLGDGAPLKGPCGLPA